MWRIMRDSGPSSENLSKSLPLEGGGQGGGDKGPSEINPSPIPLPQGERAKKKDSNRTIHTNPTWDLVLKILARHDQSEAMLREKLKKKGVDTTAIESVIQKAKGCKLVNDLAFAQNVLRKAKERGKTDLWAAAKLLSYGVNKSLIKELVPETAMEEYLEYE